MESTHALCLGDSSVFTTAKPIRKLGWGDLALIDDDDWTQWEVKPRCSVKFAPTVFTAQYEKGSETDAIVPTGEVDLK